MDRLFSAATQPLHYPSHVRQADRLADAAKLGLQLAQDDIRLVLNQSAHPLAIDPARSTACVWQTLSAASPQTP